MARNRLNDGKEGCFSRDIRKIVNDNIRDISLCTTQLDMVTGTTGTTLTSVPGMVSDTLPPGTYSFRCTIYSVATANTGIKMAFKWGTASMITSAQYTVKAFTASGVVVTSGTTATDQTALLDSTAGVVISADITGVIVIAVAGTLTFQAAQHTAHADTTSIFLNSQMEFTPTSATT